MFKVLIFVCLSNFALAQSGNSVFSGAPGFKQQSQNSPDAQRRLMSPGGGVAPIQGQAQSSSSTGPSAVRNSDVSENTNSVSGLPDSSGKNKLPGFVGGQAAGINGGGATPGGIAGHIPEGPIGPVGPGGGQQSGPISAPSGPGLTINPGGGFGGGIGSGPGGGPGGGGPGGGPPKLPPRRT